MGARASKDDTVKRKPRVIRAWAVLACLVFAVVVAVGSVPVLAWRVYAINNKSVWHKFELFDLDDPRTGRTRIVRQRLFGSTTWHHEHPPQIIAGGPRRTSAQTDPRPEWALPVSDPWPQMHVAQAVGAPFSSARGWLEVPATSAEVLPGLYLTDRPSRMLSVHLPNDILDFPFVPRWPGLLANTFLFFAIPFVPWTLLRWRRMRRIERLGLCYQCRYEFPREISICPECGTTRPPN